MTGIHDADAASVRPRSPSSGAERTGETGKAFGRPLRVLVVDADNALFGLIGEWLPAPGYAVTPGHAGDSQASEAVDLVVVDIPFPRQGGLELLRQIASRHRETPILALSSAFFAGIDSNGAVARALGVAAALPKPLKRDALIAAVENLLAAPRGRAGP